MQERGAVAALRRIRRLAVALAVAAVVVVADQVTKSAALHHLHRPVHLFGPLGLAVQENTGSAFSLFTGDSTVLAAVAAVLAAGVVWLAWRSWRLPLTVATGLVLGGAVGNLVGRIERGRVIDFITLTHWPTFNVADACITVGVILAAALLLWAPRPAGEDGTATGRRRTGVRDPAGTHPADGAGPHPADTR